MPDRDEAGRVRQNPAATTLTTTARVREHEPVPLHRAFADLLAVSDERDIWLLRLRASWQAAYALGWQHGHAAGRREAEAEQAASWREVAVPIARGGEVQRRRWAVRAEARTRETFGQPAPGDYPGRGERDRARVR
jgi:hypothetical protein